MLRALIVVVIGVRGEELDSCVWFFEVGGSEYRITVWDGIDDTSSAFGL